MRRKTTTRQLQQAITNNLLKPIKAQKYSKSTRKTTTISTEAFKDDFDFLCETIFADVVGWHYELNYNLNSALNYNEEGTGTFILNALKIAL